MTVGTACSHFQDPWPAKEAWWRRSGELLSLSLLPWSCSNTSQVAPVPSFGAPPAAPSSLPFASASSSSAAPAAATSAFGGFSFGKTPAAPVAAPAAGSGFSSLSSVGTKAAATPAAPAATPAAPKAAFGGFSFGSFSAQPVAPKAAVAGPDWVCGTCMLNNPATATEKCSICEADRPGATPAASSAPKATLPTPPAGGFAFGAPKATLPNPPAGGFAFGAPKPPVTGGFSAAATAPTTGPSIASTSNVRLPAPAAPVASASRSSSGPGPSQATPPDEGEVAYYTSLRGLNASFLSLLSQSLNANEFLDLTTVLPAVLAQYTDHLRDAANKAGWQPPKAVEAPKTNGNAAPAPAPTPAAAAPTPVSASASAPAPPFGGFTFGNASTSTAPKTAVTAPAFTPAAAAPKRNIVNDIVGEVLDKQDAPPAKAPEPAAKPIVATPAKTSSLFAFAPSGPLHATTPESKTFSPSAATTSPASTPAQLGKFGPGGSTPQLGFGTASKSFASLSGSGFALGHSSSSFSFGPSSSTAAVTSQAAPKAPFSFTAPPEAAESTSKTGLAFGAPTAPAAKSAFTFGATVPPATDKLAAKPTTWPGSEFGAPAPPPTFASFEPHVSASGATSGVVSAFTSGTATPAEDVRAANEYEEYTQSKNLAEGSGAGEEDEETVAEQRGRLHELVDGAFKVVGLGQFKLKRAKEGAKRRLLMRADGSGTVVLVSRLFRSPSERVPC